MIKQQDLDWIKLEIPAGREAYAIAGDLDKTLLVTTWTKAYYTSDKGKTWQESKNFNGHVPGLFERNDTIFSMEATSTDNQGSRYAAWGNTLRLTMVRPGAAILSTMRMPYWI
jgi:hypothetical protein